VHCREPHACSLHATAVGVHQRGMHGEGMKGGVAAPTVVTENNRAHLVLFGVQNRTLDPYLTATHKVLVSVSCALAPNATLVKS
jgi:hypothetical protein